MQTKITKFAPLICVFLYFISIGVTAETNQSLRENMSSAANDSNNEATHFIINYLLVNKPAGGIPRSGIVLTFDDRAISYWHAALPIFRKYDAKVTFFISGPDRMDAVDMQQMRDIIADGHEFAAHTMNHFRIDVYDSVDQYMQAEIYPHTEETELMGFEKPRTFAYPFGEFTDEHDEALLEYYRLIRRVRYEANPGQIQHYYYNKYTGRSIGSLSIDGPTDIPTDIQTADLVKEVETAYDLNQIIVLNGHVIAGDPDVFAYTTTHARLEAILKAAKERGMKFYTMSSLPLY